MDLKDLEDQIEVKYRTGRAGRTSVEWNPWRVGKLYVQKRQEDVPKLKRRGPMTWQAGSILTLTPTDEVTAEYGQGDYCGEGIFCAEDYYLEIEGLR